MSAEEILLDGLKDIRTGFREPWQGICAALLDWRYTAASTYARTANWHTIWELFDDLCSRWPEHSGAMSYPVPAPFRAYGECGKWDAKQAFDETHKASLAGSYDWSMNSYMWDKNTEYGAARWRLLEFLIKELEERV